jgi:uncharacterized protein YeeX (DUF496 family)
VRKVFRELDLLKQDVNENINNRTEKRELLEVKAKLMQAIEPKIEASEIQNALKACQADFSNRVYDLRQEFHSILNEQRDYLHN